MSAKITAVARIWSRTEAGDGQTRLQWSAPYADAQGNRVEENKAWAKYTPCFALDMTVLNEVAEKIEDGVDYLLTFEKKDAG
jgi:hypothetical protein